MVLLAFYGDGGQPVPAAAARSGSQLLQAAAVRIADLR
jgi:hypothetical protein